MTELLVMAFGLVRDWFVGQQKIQTAKQERAQALLATQTKLIQDETSNNAAWELAALSGKDRWLQRISFGMFSFPLVWAAFDPLAVSTYFKVGLEACPPWYLKTYMTITGVVWAVSGLKNSAPAMVSGIKTAWKNWKDPDAT